MKLISHRGNIDGREPNIENNPWYILNALSLGYDVEIDVWFINGLWYLGHDEPQDLVQIDFLKNTKGLWCHCKNIEAAFEMKDIQDIHYFYHQEDDITLTSENYLWTYPGKRPLTKASIAVMPEKTDWTQEELSICYGICSDFIKRYK